MLNKKTNILIIFFILAVTNVLAQTSFTKITIGSVVNDGEVSYAVSWGDYNNDGWLDLFVANGSGIAFMAAENFLYQNNGDPDSTGEVTFKRIYSVEIANNISNSKGSSWGDFNNDGWLDLLVTNGSFFAGGHAMNFLYQNNGDPDGTGQVSFTQIETGDMVSDEENSHGSSWGDFNNDGWLDLFVANGTNGRNSLYQNNGDPDETERVTFTRLFKREAIYEDNAHSFIGTWGDYDNDGDLDLFVANAKENNSLYQNNGDFSFSSITSGEIVNDGIVNSRGGSWGDYDNDGYLDLFVANDGLNFLYHNDGDPDGTGQITFTKITSGEVVNDGGNSRSSSWGDYDNDGDLDLFVANQVVAGQGDQNFLYQNNGDPEGTGQVTFTRIRSDDTVDDVGEFWGCCWGDYDRDGFLDLYIANSSDVQGAQNNFLYRNNGNLNNWINIKCIGRFSNRSAIGARVRIKATINGKPVQQIREISAQTGNYSQNSLNVEFGLGDASVIDSIQIAWPSGRNQLLTDYPVNEFMTIPEEVFLEVQEIAQPEVGQMIVVSALDTSGYISEVFLSYRRGDVSDDTTVVMPDLGGGSFQTTIPASEVTAAGLEYHLVAVDKAGRSARIPMEGSFSARVRIPNGLSNGEPRPHGSAQSAYRIFSVPLDLDNKSPAALLEDDLGEYDDTRWRFVDFLGDDNNTDFPDITEIVHGKGYWFIVSEPARVIDSGSGSTTILSEEFAITLSTGWNLIGNPFNFPIPVENLRLADGSVAKIRTFSGAWNNTVTEKVELIMPWEGFAISTSATTLFINPDISSSNSLLAEKTQENSILWAIQILAQCQQARDVDNIAGVGLFASVDRDQYDLPEPPTVGEYVSVYFPHPEWERFSKRLSTDTRSELSEGEEWEFEVKTNIHDLVNLTFKQLETVPAQYEIWLVDKALKITNNLRQKESYSVSGGTENNPKKLSLVVGKQGFLQEIFTELRLVPENYELSQNFPNPFNPVTTIRYGLPGASRISLTVYNLLGKEVITLVSNELMEAGYHAAIWDSRNTRGNVVVSGVYFIRMQAGNFVQTRKMLLIE